MIGIGIQAPPIATPEERPVYILTVDGLDISSETITVNGENVTVTG